MNLYEKIGRLIKHNKISDLSDNSHNDSKQNETSLGLELEHFESILSEILSPLKSEIKSPISNLNLKNNKLISKSDLEEAQRLIKTCSQDQQLILISILEIQISLNGDENNYIKYETLTEKIIEKNIYWVISYEIHTRIHQKEGEFKEYCHYIKDKKEENILSDKNNFKYENIDKIICELKRKNKKIEFIGIKTIFISFYNLVYEYAEKYVEIFELNKKNNKNLYEFFIFDYIINDYIYIIEKIQFLNSDFKQSLNDFINEHDLLNFSFENLFKEIFFNVILHNQILGFRFIQEFIHSESDRKKLFVKVLDIIENIKSPLIKEVAKILNIENLFNYKIDLVSKIMEQNEQTHICLGVGKCEIKSDEEKGEIVRKKEIIVFTGKIGKKDKNEDDFDMDKIIIGLNKDKNDDSDDDDDNIIERKIIINRKIIKKAKIESEKEEKQEDIKDCDNKQNIDKNINNNNETNKPINIQEIKENNINDNNQDINKSKKETTKEKENMDDKSLDEIYEYINKDNKVKGRKKNKRRNKAKLKKNKSKKGNNESTMDDSEDPIVTQFKNDIKEYFIHASTITKIKPLISDNFIKSITSY